MDRYLNRHTNIWTDIHSDRNIEKDRKTYTPTSLKSIERQKKTDNAIDHKWTERLMNRNTNAQT